MHKKECNNRDGKRMSTEFTVNVNEEEFSLRNAVELFALGICEDISKNEKRIEDIERKCKILNSLSNALMAVKN